MAESTPITTIQLENNVAAHVSGRLTALVSGGDTAFLLDVTDCVDPTTTDPSFPEVQAEKIVDLMSNNLNDPDLADRYAMHNGVIVLITGKLQTDDQPQKRVFVAISSIAPDKSNLGDIESSTTIFERAGFQDASNTKMYVPFSFDGPEIATQIIRAEIQKASEERETSSRKKLAPTPEKILPSPDN